MIDEMIESIEVEINNGGGRSLFHLKMIKKVILQGYSKKSIPHEVLKVYSAKKSLQNDSQLDKEPIIVELFAFVRSMLIS
jgi:hypothetical protein